MSAFPAVLVVDDDERILAGYKRSLERGWAVFTTTTASVASQLATEHRFALAILDLHLEGSSSLSLIRELKAAQPTVKIVLISGYLTTEATMIAVHAGADLVLDKPVSPREVVQRVQRGAPVDVDTTETPTLTDAIEAHIARVYNDCQGNVSEAARRLGIYRSSLQRRLRKQTVKRVNRA